MTEPSDEILAGLMKVYRMAAFVVGSKALRPTPDELQSAMGLMLQASDAILKREQFLYQKQVDYRNLLEMRASQERTRD